MTEKTTSYGGVRRMFLGMPLAVWENIMVGSLAFAAIAAGLVGVSTFSVVRLQREELAELSKNLSDANSNVAELGRQSEQLRKDTADANVRAAALEKDAAAAKLETEKLKGIVAWRTLDPAAAEKLETALATSPGAVNLRYTDGDPEALYLAMQIGNILSKAGWKVAPGAVKFANGLVFGIALPDGAGADALRLRAALSAAQLTFGTAALPPLGAAFNVTTIAGAPTLMIGSRAPAVP